MIWREIKKLFCADFKFLPLVGWGLTKNFRHAAPAKTMFDHLNEKHISFMKEIHLFGWVSKM